MLNYHNLSSSSISQNRLSDYKNKIDNIQVLISNEREA